MPGRLVARGGSNAGAVFLLGPSLTTLGRGPDNDIVTDSSHASRYHAEVRWDGVHYVAHDLGSKNGTTVNSRRLTQPQPLNQGDILEIPGLALMFDLAADTLTLGPSAAPEEEAIRVDSVTAEVWVRGSRVSVSAKEYLALAYLYTRAGALVSKETLAETVWPEYQGNVSDYNVEQLISRLRRKLEEQPERPRHLLTVRGLGYRLVQTGDG
jgi:pSer/pThr/pTyr-binding forkhead associated (FHA) protein